MADTTFTIPEPGSDPERMSYCEQIATTLEAGNNVVFKDRNGNSAYVNYVNCSADGSFTCIGPGRADNEKRTLYFIKGGWHRHAIHKVFSGGTDASCNWTVKL